VHTLKWTTLAIELVQTVTGPGQRMSRDYFGVSKMGLSKVVLVPDGLDQILDSSMESSNLCQYPWPRHSIFLLLWPPWLYRLVN
jgi:hypothetical protein